MFLIKQQMALNHDCFFPIFSKALSAPLLLKAKETCNLSGETCVVLHQCLEQLSEQEEVGEDLHHLKNYS